LTEGNSKLSRESAEEQFNLFMDYYDIDPEDWADSLQVPFQTAKNRLIRAITKGNLSIEAGDPIRIVQILIKPKGDTTELVYSEMSGRAKVAMKGKDETDTFGKIYALVGSLTGLGETAITRLTGADMSIAESIGLLFLQI